jgi:enterochelin esterase-like enzyme
MFILKRFALLAILAAVGCTRLADNATPIPTNTVLALAQPSDTPAPTLDPLDEASFVLASPSSTRAPTETAIPTDTATPTATPTLTATPTRTFTPTATRTPTPYPIPSGTIARIDSTFRSASLGMDREVIVYLPPGYDATPQRRYPVLYLLHGWGGFDLKHTTEWEQWGLQQGVQDLIVKGVSQPMIVVQPLSYLPNPPNECSLYFNHGPGTDGKPWGDYIWKDVVNYVDAAYRTLPRRESRAIGGFSFGGQGALSLGLTHPEVFKVIGGHSPSFRQADGAIDFMNDPNWFNQFDPVWLVKNTNAAKQLSIWMDVALGDDKVRNCGEGSDHCVEAFHALLSAQGIPHAWQDQWPGPHEGSYWEGHLPDYMAWYSSQLVGQ